VNKPTRQFDTNAGPDAWIEMLKTNFPQKGAVDLFCGQINKPDAQLSAVAGLCLALLMIVDVDDSERTAFQDILVLFPFHTSEYDTKRLNESVIEKIMYFYARMKTVTNKEHLKKSIEARIKILIIDNCNSEMLITKMSTISVATAIVICNADVFVSVAAEVKLRTEEELFDKAERVKLSLPEDYWVPNVHYLITELINLGKTKPLYAFLLVFKGRPLKDNNVKLLQSVDNLAIYYLEVNADDIAVAENLAKWTQLANENRIDEMLADIDSRHFSVENAALIKMQCLFAANRYGRARAVIVPLIERLKETRDASVFLKISQVAVEAADFTLAGNTLEVALSGGLQYEQQFALALHIAKKIGNDAVTEEITRQLIDIFSTSPFAVSERFNSCRTPRDYQELYNLLNNLDISNSEDAIKYFHIMTKHFSEEEPNYDAIERDVLTQVPAFKLDRALACTLKLFSKQNFHASAKILLSTDWQSSFLRDATGVAINIIRKLFIAKEATTLNADEASNKLSNADVIRKLLQLVITYLKSHPSDGNTRTFLSSTFSPDVAGTFGFAHLLHTMGKSPPPKIEERKQERRESKEALSDNDFLDYLDKYLSTLGPIVLLGTGELQDIDLKHPLDEVFDRIVAIMRYIARNGFIENADIQLSFQMLHLGIMMARKIDRKHMDLRLTALVGSGLCLSGMYQKARDLAEHCLLIAGDDADGLRQRIAWNVFADIYMRSHNPLDALLGLVCAKQCMDEPVPASDYYNELSHEMQLLRNTGFYKQALVVVGQAKDIAKRFPETDATRKEIVFQELSINTLLILSTYGRHSKEDLNALRQVAEELLLINRDEREGGGDVLPSSTLLAQLAYLLRNHNDSFAEVIMEELSGLSSRLGEQQSLLLNALSEGNPSLNQIRRIASRLVTTRNTKDIASDVRVIKILAHRALSNKVLLNDIESVAYLVEWLSDLSIRLLEGGRTESCERDQLIEVAKRKIIRTALAEVTENSETVKTGIPLLGLEIDNEMLSTSVVVSSPSDLHEYLKRLSATPVEIHLLGTDSDNNLVNLTLLNESGIVHFENHTIFDWRTYLKWRKKYPFEYANIDHFDPHKGVEFIESSLQGIGFTALPNDGDLGRETPLLIIAETDLQSVPPNLFLVKGRLAGEVSVVASAPSISWLRSAHENRRRPSGHSHAWISSFATSGGWNTLALLHEETAPIVEKYHIPLSNDPLPPPELKDSDIVIIGAHGGLHQGNAWFRVVADEQTTRLSSRDIAESLAGSGVVILFVCSGGRLDSNPFTSATVGLSRLLLDQGCRAVVASPWPMAATLLHHWLPTFLDSYIAGSSVAKATFDANRITAVNYHSHPMISLAMNVFGDPLLTYR
jgi:tetratricopeptide (TPR) repeat protein